MGEEQALLPLIPFVNPASTMHRSESPREGGEPGPSVRLPGLLLA